MPSITRNKITNKGIGLLRSSQRKGTSAGYRDGEAVRGRSKVVKLAMGSKVPKRALRRKEKVSTQRSEHERNELTKAGMPNFLQPSISSLFPPQFEVMNTTSASHSL